MCVLIEEPETRPRVFQRVTVSEASKFIQLAKTATGRTFHSLSSLVQSYHSSRTSGQVPHLCTRPCGTSCHKHHVIVALLRLLRDHQHINVRHRFWGFYRLDEAGQRGPATPWKHDGVPEAIQRTAVTGSEQSTNDTWSNGSDRTKEGHTRTTTTGQVRDHIQKKKDCT